MPISKLRFSNVGPFDDIEFEFDPQVNVFTGPNNSGKSTALWVLGDVVVFPFDYPNRLFSHGRSSKFELHLHCESEYMFTGKLPLDIWQVGLIDSEGNPVPTEPSHLYSVRTLEMIGYSRFIPALRLSTDFRASGPTPAHIEQDERRRTARSGLHPELRKRFNLGSGETLHISDETVIQEVIDLDYRSYLRNEPAFRNIIEQIGEVAFEITDGFLIEFSRVTEDDYGFFPEFSTVDGPMPLNTLSQGTQSIVQWLAHLLIGYAAYHDFPKTLKDKPGILIIDEIDAHLHPSWQRRIIPTLTKHFPSLQIFCSTHSPLMLAGLKAGQVQLLQRDEDNRVTVSTNEVDLVAWSADEVLRNFLGVGDPTDQRTVKKLKRLRVLQGKQELSTKESEEMESLSDEVSEDLLSGPVAAQVDRFIQALEQAKAGEL